MFKYILVLFYLFTVANAVIVDHNDVWDTISQYALGIWKYYNNTAIVSTIPHS